MTGLDSLLTPARVMCRVDAASRKRVFELAAQHIASTEIELTEDLIYSQLLAREKLGSTGLGQGVAVPHCRLDGCDTPTGCLMTLAQGVDFDAPDNQKVDLLFLLFVPNEATQAHLDLLAEIARRFSSGDFCRNLRAATTPDELLGAALAGAAG